MADYKFLSFMQKLYYEMLYFEYSVIILDDNFRLFIPSFIMSHLLLLNPRDGFSILFSEKPIVS